MLENKKIKGERKKNQDAASMKTRPRKTRARNQNNGETRLNGKWTKNNKNERKNGFLRYQ